MLKSSIISLYTFKGNNRYSKVEQFLIKLQKSGRIYTSLLANVETSMVCCDWLRHGFPNFSGLRPTCIYCGRPKTH